MTAQWVAFQALAVAAGLAIGSFLNVCIARWPAGASVVKPRSRCPDCRTPIAWFDNIPVLSWVLLRGRCRHCGLAISPTYPLIELIGGLLSWLVLRRFVAGPEALDGVALAAWAAYFGFLCMLVVATYVDVRHRIIPDQVSIYAVPFALLAVAGLQALGFSDFLAITWKQSVLGAAATGGGFWAVGAAFRFIRGKEGLGWGDIKLVTLIGAALGPVPGALAAVFWGSLLGSVGGIVSLVITRRFAYLAFGPSLAAGAALYVLYGEHLAPLFFPALTLGR